MATITLFRDEPKELTVTKKTLIDCGNIGLLISFDNKSFRKVENDLFIDPGTIYIKTKEESTVVDYQEVN